MAARKTAASAPKAEPVQEPTADVTDGSASAVEGPAAEAPEEGMSTTPAADSADKKPAAEAPERSELQPADKPCEECCPNGWPEGSFSVGCTHGTWIRETD